MRRTRVTDIRVTGWDELNERLFEHSWRQSLGRHRSNFAFRGMQNAGHDLTTGLIRLGAYDNLEGHLLRNFRKYAHRDAVPGDSVWNWLAVAQHHGLPTRLLDWTFSPYVAMHFATEDISAYNVDGVIWCFDYAQSNQHLPSILTAILVEERADVFTAEMLSHAASTLSEFDGLAESDFVVFFEPPSLDDRIVNQFALFSLMSSATRSLDSWMAQHPEFFRRIIIPAELKWEIRDKLDQANISERVLFPGLDGLSRWLKRYYTPAIRTKPGMGRECGTEASEERPVEP